MNHESVFFSKGTQMEGFPTFVEVVFPHWFPTCDKIKHDLWSFWHLQVNETHQLVDVTNHQAVCAEWGSLLAWCQSSWWPVLRMESLELQRMPSLKLTVRDWTWAEAQKKLVSQSPSFRFHVSSTSETKWNQILDRQCLFEGSYVCRTSRWSCMQPAEQELSKRTLYRLYLFDPPLISVVWLLLHWSLL